MNGATNCPFVAVSRLSDQINMNERKAVASVGCCKECYEQQRNVMMMASQHQMDVENGAWKTVLAGYSGGSTVCRRPGVSAPALLILTY